MAAQVVGRPVADGDRGWARALIAEAWGGLAMVSRGGLARRAVRYAPAARPVDEARRLKPGSPEIRLDGILLGDELALERLLD